MKSVFLHQARLPAYREELFSRLHQRCAERNIAFTLIAGQPSNIDARRKDADQREASQGVQLARNQYVRLLGRDLLWQPRSRASRSADLVVLSHESRILSNYPILLAPRRQKIAFFGHGRNFQNEGGGGIAQQWKQFWVRRVDWWFAYTELSADAVRGAGFDERRITVLNNAIDVDALQAEVASITDEECAARRADHRIDMASPVGLYCGALYPEKRLRLLIDACAEVRQRVPDFHLVVLGDGPSASEIREAAAANPWIQYLGATTGRAKATWLRTAKVMLNPGTVGLHILDSFAAGLPLVSTLDALHSPEISYAVNDENAVLVDGTVEAYSDAISRLLTDISHHARIAERARRDAAAYGLDDMVERFVTGFEDCLGDDRAAGRPRHLATTRTS